MTSVAELKEWFDEGVELGATHMVVKYDDFDNEDYPMYVFPAEDVRKRESSNADRTMEVYNLALSWESQGIGGTRVWNY